MQYSKLQKKLRWLFNVSYCGSSHNITQMLAASCILTCYQYCAQPWLKHRKASLLIFPKEYTYTSLKRGVTNVHFI